MKKFVYYILFSSILFTVSCAKSPEKVDSPGIKIDVVTKERVESYTLRFSGGIKNENAETAFVQFKGTVQFIDPIKRGLTVFSLPFELPVILPFASGIIDTSVELTEKDLGPLLDLLGLSKKELLKNKSIEKFNISERFLKLDSPSYVEKDVIDLLKDKMNEKN